MIEMKTDLAKAVDAYDVTFKEEADRIMDDYVEFATKNGRSQAVLEIFIFAELAKLNVIVKSLCPNGVPIKI
jgi:hypothetical protein